MIYGNETNMAPCKPWSESEPTCDKDILNLVNLTSLEDNHILHKQFYLVQDDCTDGEMKIAFLDNDEYVYLSYNDQVNSSVIVGDDNECFVIKYQLCGPDSVSFQSNGDTLLYLTACNGTITMKQQFDFCG